jgi:hypothetical protein
MDGNTAKVRPPALKKFDQYRLLSDRESKNGVKLPKYASLLENALPNPSTIIKTNLELLLSY